jgi:CheY-like chemotaxis protein
MDVSHRTPNTDHVLSVIRDLSFCRTLQHVSMDRRTSTSREDARRALAAGFERYLCKPIDPAQLTDAVRTVIAERRHSAGQA